MTRQVCIVAVGLCLGVCQFAAADEAEDFMTYYSWWDGEWQVEVKTGDETETTHFVIEQHKPGCHLVKSDEGIAIWGYDPGRKRWVGTGFDSDGSRFTTIIERHKGDTIKPVI
jgi:hypothetical protein